MVLADSRLRNLPQKGEAKSFTGKGIAVAFTAAFMLTFVSYFLAQNVLNGHNFADYWFFKIVFVGLTLCVGMGMSAVLKEYAIWRLARRTHGQASFYTSVIRANYITLGLILFITKAGMVPKRLTAPHYILQRSWAEK
jgi:hypothetical protein